MAERNHKARQGVFEYAGEDLNVHWNLDRTVPPNTAGDPNEEISPKVAKSGNASPAASVFRGNMSLHSRILVWPPFAEISK